MRISQITQVKDLFLVWGLSLIYKIYQLQEADFILITEFLGKVAPLQTLFTLTAPWLTCPGSAGWKAFRVSGSSLSHDRDYR